MTFSFSPGLSVDLEKDEITGGLIARTTTVLASVPAIILAMRGIYLELISGVTFKDPSAGSNIATPGIVAQPFASVTARAFQLPENGFKLGATTTSIVDDSTSEPTVRTSLALAMGVPSGSTIFTL